MKQQLCIVMPAMNEEKTISDVVRSIIDCGYEVIVVDDASTDLTRQNAKNSGAIVLTNLKNLGAWKSTQTGLRYAQKLGFTVVITMDADGQHSANDIDLLVTKHNSGSDIVIGNCTERGSTGRHIAWRFFKVFNRLNINDITSGFRLYNKKALHVLTSKQATMFEYQCVGVLLMMRNMGLNIGEVPVSMSERATGVSRIFHSWSAVSYYLIYTGLLSATKAFPTKKERYMNRLTGFNNLD